VPPQIAANGLEIAPLGRTYISYVHGLATLLAERESETAVT
jgi:hypothetical protein